MSGSVANHARYASLCAPSPFRCYAAPSLSLKGRGGVEPLAPQPISTDKAAMAQITSRFELRNWLRKKPRSWSQVLAARAALQVIPYAFNRRMQKKWYKSNALALIRPSSLSWIIVNTQNSNVDLIYSVLKSTDGCDNASISAEAFGQNNVSYAFDTSSNAARTVSGITYSIRASNALADAALATFNDANRICVWRNCSYDCDWLSGQSDADLAAYTLTRMPLWSVSEPDDWQQSWRYSSALLSNLDPTYQVWINWYNRRIEGHDAAFDIPGDTNRIHDKAILARLAGATDEDFWGKGATYVNTTLQGWIDEARIEARIDQITAKLRGGATAHYGAPEELAERAVLLDELDRLLGKSPQARHGIGGNHPPEPIDASEQSMALAEEVREPLEVISTELEKREPDALVVVEQVKLLHRAGRKLQKMGGLASDEFAKSVGGELGKRIVQAAFWLTLINQILDWLAPLIR